MLIKSYLWANRFCTTHHLSFDNIQERLAVIVCVKTQHVSVWKEWEWERWRNWFGQRKEKVCGIQDKTATRQDWLLITMCLNALGFSGFPSLHDWPVLACWNEGSLQLFITALLSFIQGINASSAADCVKTRPWRELVQWRLLISIHR